MATAFSYSRFSSRAQAKGDSLRRQISAAYEYAEANSLTLDTTLQDHGISGFSGANRTKGALKSFLDRVERGEIERGSYLLIDSMDRLSREKVAEATHQLLGIALAGITVVTLNDKRKFDQNATLVDMILSVAEIERSHRESAEKGRKVAIAHKESKRKAREEGLKWNALCPTWLALDKAAQRYDKIPERVTLIQRVFNMAEEGLGTFKIAGALNDEKVAMAKGGAINWNTTTVYNILRNRAVIGEYQPHTFTKENGKRIMENDGLPIPDYFPAIIDLGQFYRVQEILTARNKNKGKKPNAREFNNLLPGLVRCYSCGGTVSVKRGVNGRGRRDMLRCVQAERKLCENKLRVPYLPFEDAILLDVCEWAVPSATRKSNPSAMKLTQAESTIKDLESRIARVQSDIDLEESDQIRKMMWTQLAQRSDELTVAQKVAGELRIKVQANDTEAPIQARQEALRRLIDRLGSVEGEELYRLRAGISAALAGVIDLIDFDPNGDVRVILMGKRVAYRFQMDLNRWQRIELPPEYEQ